MEQDFDGELRLAFRKIAETRKQLEERGELRRLAQLHMACGVMGATVLGSMIRGREVVRENGGLPYKLNQRESA